jgi:hypothetical protein
VGEPRLLHADKGAEEKGHHVQCGIGDHHPDGAEGNGSTTAIAGARKFDIPADRL